MSLPQPQPTAPSERVGLLDALRGFAIGGILLANIAALSGWFFMSPAQQAAVPGAAATGVLDFLVHWLVDGKFYSIFSLLFGIGFSLQLGRAEAREAPFVPLFRRRLLLLAAIGLGHLLLWPGDILLLYALTGLLLIPFRRLGHRALLTWGAALVLAPIPLYLIVWASHGTLDPGNAPMWLMGRLLALGGPSPVGTGAAEGPNPFDLLARGGPLEFIQLNVVGMFYRYSDILSTHRIPKVLGMFLVGLWVGRSGLPAALAERRHLLRRIAVWGLGLGLPFSLAQAWLMSRTYFVPSSAEGFGLTVAYALGVAPLGLGYSAVIALWWLGSGQSVLRRLEPVGRMALTNYLMHTVAGIAIFYGVGAGLAGSMGPAGFLPLALLIVALQIPLSTWWLAHYRFGPVEWLWRRLTYRRPLPLRRGTPAVPPPT